jgi:hypothetical protein
MIVIVGIGVQTDFPYSTYDSHTKIKDPMKLGYGIRKVTSPAKTAARLYLIVDRGGGLKG